jgi:hypothetical protein
MAGKQGIQQNAPGLAGVAEATPYLRIRSLEGRTNVVYNMGIPCLIDGVGHNTVKVGRRHDEDG